MDVTTSVDAARERAQSHIDAFARKVQDAVARELPRGVNKFLAAVGAHVDELATLSTASLDEATRPWAGTPEVDRLRGRFSRDARLTFAPILAYSKGFVDGGGAGSPADLAVSLVSAWAEPALAAWYERVIQDLAALDLSAVEQASSAGPEAPLPDLATLLARAAALGIRIKNVPEAPTRRYLEKLHEQLEDRARKTAPAAAPAQPDPTDPTRDGRLQVLLAFAEELKVRVKTVPDQPSESWLQKMEEKLREVAGRKGVALPPNLGGSGPAAGASGPGAPPRPPTASTDATPALPPHREAAHDDAAGTPMWAPDRATAGQATGVERLAPPPDPAVAEERKRRVESLIERAAEAGLELGRIPSAPTDEWIAQTETLLETAINKRKEERKAERKRKEAERKTRIQQLGERAARLGVDLGPIPPFPTDDWIARAALRIQTAMLGPTKADADSGRRDRLKKLVADADTAGVDLGEVPPDPDDEWLAWAEAEVQRQESAAEGAIALVSEGFDALVATLVYEEGTVQEESWPVDAENPVTVGRGRGNTVHVRDDAGISRQHFTLWVEGGRYWLRDEGSTKGTSVNGQRAIEEVELRGDEVIVASETQFVFRLR